MATASREALRYLDQVVDHYDPELGLALPEQLAYLVSLDHLPPGQWTDQPEAAWRTRLGALLRDRSAPRLRTLILHDCSEHTIDGCDIPFEDSDPAPLLRRHPGRLARLERLHIGVFPPALPPAGGYCQGLGAALAGLPALRHLHLLGERGWELVPPAGHPGLRALLLHIAEPDDDLPAALAGAAFPALARLDLWAGDAVLADADLDALTDALASPRFAELSELALRGLDRPDLLSLLARDDLGGLRKLAVTHAPGLDDDAFAGLLAASWLPRLTRLELRGVAVSPALIAELRARGPEVVA